jgi:hypothetical protein
MFGEGRVSEKCFAPPPSINGSSLNVINELITKPLVLQNSVSDCLIIGRIDAERRALLNGVRGKFTGFEEGAGHPVKPKGGPRAVLETLEDAVTFMSSVKLRQQTWPCWDGCAREILNAARTGKRVDIVGATRCLEIALRRDDWL